MPGLGLADDPWVQLLKGTSHELNHLVSLIKSFVTFALEDTSPDHPATAHLAQAQQLADRVFGLSRALRGLALDPVIPEARCDAAAVIQSVAARPPWCEQIVVAAGNAPWLAVQSADLELILCAVLSNAREAPQARRINIAVDDTAASALLDPSLVCLQIDDDGEGFAQDALQRAFEPFFTTKKGHRGLGLFACHLLAARYAGRVVVPSGLAAGARVQIYLPRAQL